MKKIIIPVIVLSMSLLIYAIYDINSKSKQASSRQAVIDENHFEKIKKVNDLLIQNLPDTQNINMLGFKAHKKFNRDKYLFFFNDSKDYDSLESMFEKNALYNIWGSKKEGFLYKYDSKDVFPNVVQVKVYAYLYCEGSIQNSDTYKGIGAYEIEFINQVEDNWYKIVYIGKN